MMNNYKEIRLTHYMNSGPTARFKDGSDQVRRYTNLTPSSVKRLQNQLYDEAHRNNDFKIRIPGNFQEVGWVADRK